MHRGLHRVNVLLVFCSVTSPPLKTGARNANMTKPVAKMVRRASHAEKVASRWSKIRRLV